MIDISQDYVLSRLAESDSFIARNDREIITPVIWNGLVTPLYDAFNYNVVSLRQFINNTTNNLNDLQGQINALLLDEFPANSLPGGSITDNTISNSKLMDNSVNTSNIVDNAVTVDKVASLGDLLKALLSSSNNIEVHSGTLNIGASYTFNDWYVTNNSFGSNCISAKKLININIPFDAYHSVYFITLSHPQGTQYQYNYYRPIKFVLFTDSTQTITKIIQVAEIIKNKNNNIASFDYEYEPWNVLNNNNNLNLFTARVGGGSDVNGYTRVIQYIAQKGALEIQNTHAVNIPILTEVDAYWSEPTQNRIDEYNAMQELATSMNYTVIAI